ncbi:hypothetical protein HGRIS_008152 [Hohenbuehelia grisea]|uniref:Small ribosomal subunit protein mS23 n=1 Tax=Hohenbuehelia grisea TaxID=104357 RepID=A0ABR3J754_9AGAR
MVRRIASQVHRQVGRLMRADFIRQEPVWFKAVLDHPPLPLPPRAPPARSTFDTTKAKPKLKPKSGNQDENGDASSSSRHKTRMRSETPKPLPIYYLEDDIRRQFFRDHPFEAFRPVTLVESAAIRDPHPIAGVAWTRLRQRGRNPCPQDAIDFCLNLYRSHNIPLSEAYSRAVAQFRALRSEHHIATLFATHEATHLGAIFGASENERAYFKELRSLETWSRSEELDEGAMAARKRWKAIVERSGGKQEWSKGQEYVRLWKEGIRPTYSPVLTQRAEELADLGPTPEEEVAQSTDFMALRS